MVDAFVQVGVTGVTTGIGVSKDFPVSSNLRTDAGDAALVGVEVRIACALVCSSTIGADVAADVAANGGRPSLARALSLSSTIYLPLESKVTKNCKCNI
jgi:hypothetical protein